MPSVTHPFVSGKADGGDATLVRPSNWNATHSLAYSNHAISGEDTIALADDSVTLAAGTYGVTVPAATGSGKPIFVYMLGAGVVTLNRSGSDTIGGATSFALSGVSDWCVLIDEAAGAWGLQSTNGGATLWIVAPGACLSLKLLTKSVAAGTWDVDYLGDIVATGKSLTVSNSLILAGTDGTTVTFPGSSTKVPQASQTITFSGPTASRTVTLPDANTTVPTATQPLTFSGPTAGRTITLPDASFTAARTDAANTFTGTQTFSSAPVINGTTSTFTASGAGQLLGTSSSSAAAFVAAPTAGLMNLKSTAANAISWSLNSAGTTAASSGINTTETVISPTMAIPAGALVAGSSYRIRVIGTCTPTAANLSTFTIRMGTNNTTADTTLMTLTMTSSTSGSSVPFWGEFVITVRSLNSSTGNVIASGVVTNSGTTGINTVATPVFVLGSVVTSINTTSAIQNISLAYKSAATTTTSTFQQVTTEAL